MGKEILLDKAHPRWRGEHALVFVGFLSWSGSSPLARGAQKRVLSPLPRPRLIPAGAGSTVGLTAKRSAA